MSSAGIISKVYSNPTSRMGENNRQSEKISSGTSPHEQVKRVTGKVTHVNAEKSRLVKAVGLDGAILGNGDWIELNHSSEEIAERWGTIRPGFYVRVTLSGPTGSGADATIVGAEQQNVEEPHTPNEVARGLYFIFGPGVGL